MIHAVVAILLGVLIGVFSGLFGVGGSISTPLLRIVLGTAPLIALGSALGVGGLLLLQGVAHGVRERVSGRAG